MGKHHRESECTSRSFDPHPNPLPQVGKGIRNALAFACVVALLSSSAFAQVRAFPEAEGFGRFATGARTNLAAASVYRVTNLNDAGAGSFRDAVSQPNRFVVFDVSGVIQPTTGPIIVQDNVTIAGQTAPGGGITVYGDRLSYTSADNTITRFLRVRKGTRTGRNDAVSIARGQNMMFDHVSVAWGNDETFSINPDSGYVIDKITIQNSIVGQGLDNVNHSAGGLMQLVGGNFSVLRSLFIDNETRSPKARGNNHFVNNVVYNWTTAAYIMGDTTNATSKANIEGNYFIKGPSGGNNPFSSGTSTFQVYQRDNWYDGNVNGSLDGAMLNPASYPGAQVVVNPHDFPRVAVDSAQNAYQYLLDNVGHSLHRDPIDQRMIDEVASKGTLGQIILDEDLIFQSFYGTPGYPSLPTAPKPIDTDNDAIPDAWEVASGLNPNNSADWKTLSVSGYTMLEEYFNGLASNHADKVWTAASGNWPTNGNWNGGLPTWNDDALVHGDGAGSSGNLTLSTAGATAMTLRIGGNGVSPGESVTVANGGSLFLVDTLHVGAANRGTMTIQAGGNVEVPNIVLGNATGNHVGILAIEGGTLKTSRIASATAGSAVTLNGGTIRAASQYAVLSPVVLNAGGGTIDSAGFDGTVSGEIFGAGGLTKRGAGTLTLNANNTYTGATTIEGGTIAITAMSNAGTGSQLGASSSDAANLVLNGGTLRYAGTTSTSTDRAFTIGVNGGTLDSGSQGQMRFVGTASVVASGTGNRTLTLTGTSSLNDFYLGLADPESGKTSLAKTGTGRWILNAPASPRSYSGDTTVSAGTLMTNHDNPLPFGAGQGNLVIASGATFEMNGRNMAINGLQGAGTLNQRGNTTRTLTLGHGEVNATYSGVLSDTPSGTQGVLHLTKVGNGAQTLTGANTYDGVTTVEAGTLILGTLATQPVFGGAAVANPAGADIRGGKLIFDYAAGTSPAAAVVALLDSGFDSGFSGGLIRSTTVSASRGLGWMDEVVTKKFIIASTYYGDANLDFQVNFDDLLVLAQSYGSPGATWSNGDFNYDGLVGFDDLLQLAQNYDAPASFEADWQFARSLVPEPGMASLVAVACSAARRLRGLQKRSLA